MSLETPEVRNRLPRTTFFMRRKRRAEERKARLTQPEIRTPADLATHVVEPFLPLDHKALEALARNCYLKSTGLVEVSNDGSNAWQVLAALKLSGKDYGKVGAFISEKAREAKKRDKKRRK